MQCPALWSPYYVNKIAQLAEQKDRINLPIEQRALDRGRTDKIPVDGHRLTEPWRQG